MTRWRHVAVNVRCKQYHQPLYSVLSHNVNNCPGLRLRILEIWKKARMFSTKIETKSLFLLFLLFNSGQLTPFQNEFFKLPQHKRPNDPLFHRFLAKWDKTSRERLKKRSLIYMLRVDYQKCSNFRVPSQVGEKKTFEQKWCSAKELKRRPPLIKGCKWNKESENAEVENTNFWQKIQTKSHSAKNNPLIPQKIAIQYFLHEIQTRFLLHGKHAS